MRASDTLYRDVSHVYRPVSCRHIVIWDVRLDTYRYMHDTSRYNDANRKRWGKSRHLFVVARQPESAAHQCRHDNENLIA